MVEYVVVTPQGEEYNLTTGNQGVFMEQGGAEGLPRAQPQENGVAVVGVPGERYTGMTIPKAEGSFTVSCFPHEGLSNKEVESRFKAGFSHHREGWFIIKGWPQGDLKMRFRLAGFSAPTRQAKHGIFTRVTVDLSAARGLWDQQFTGTGVVQVVNMGDAVIHPRARWREGGDLVMPSGAVVPLPTVSDARTLVLDASESNVVIDDQGEVDHEVWGSFPVYPEGVPVGETRTYQLPDGATLIWDVGYLDPWK